MVGWHHRLDGHEFEQVPGVGDGQGSLACCSPWGHKESDRTELNWKDTSVRSTRQKSHGLRREATWSTGTPERPGSDKTWEGRMKHENGQLKQHSSQRPSDGAEKRLRGPPVATASGKTDDNSLWLHYTVITVILELSLASSVYSAVILCFITRNIHLVFIPASGTELPKPWGLPQCWERDKGIFCYLNEVTHGKPLGCWLVARGTNHMIRGLEISVLPPPKRDEGLEIDFNHQQPMIQYSLNSVFAMKPL